MSKQSMVVASPMTTADAVLNSFVTMEDEQQSIADASPITKTDIKTETPEAETGCDRVIETNESTSMVPFHDKHSKVDAADDVPLTRANNIKTEIPMTETGGENIIGALESTSYNLEESDLEKEEQRISDTDGNMVPAQISRPTRGKGGNFRKEDFKSEALWKQFLQYRSQRRRDIEATNYRNYRREQKLKSTIKQLLNKDYYAAAKALEESRKARALQEKPKKPKKENISRLLEDVEVLIITRLYLYLQKEYEFIKTLTSDNTVLTTLADVIKRTAEATCVTEDTVKTILERQAKQKTSVQEKAGIEANKVPAEPEMEIKDDVSISQEEDAMEIDSVAQHISQPSEPVHYIATNTTCSQLHQTQPTNDQRPPNSMLFLEVCPLVVRSSPDVSRVKTKSPPAIKSEPADEESLSTVHHTPPDIKLEAPVKVEPEEDQYEQTLQESPWNESTPPPLVWTRGGKCPVVVRPGTAYNRTMEKQPDEPENFTNEPLPSMSEPVEVQDALASTSATPFAQPIIAASKSKAQKQREYRQRIAASRTPAQAAAARKSKNERQRKNRLRQAANLASGSLEATTISSSCSGEESNNVQTRSLRPHAQQQSTTTANQPDERVNLTNEPLFSAIPVPMENQEAVASTSATPLVEPITAPPKTRAQIQREYRQRIAASRTPAQVAAAREARNIRERNKRLRQAANSAIASSFLEATTTSSFFRSSPDVSLVKDESPSSVKSEPADNESSPDVCRVKIENPSSVKSEPSDDDIDIEEHQIPYTVPTPTTTENSSVPFHSYYNNDHSYFATTLK